MLRSPSPAPPPPPRALSPHHPPHPARAHDFPPFSLSPRYAKNTLHQNSFSLLISRVLKWRMGKGSKIGCKMASHQLFKDKAKNRVDDLHGMFTDPQFARKESRSIDVAVLEEQVHQVLHEWKVELNEASPASSLLGNNSLASSNLSSDIRRLLQLCEEEDDATSALAAPTNSRL
ncbi:hypothetical protein AAC387_Pa03g1761 [Persea americana]